MLNYRNIWNMLKPTQTELLDLTTSNAESGFRLERLEVYNWGTFNKHVWNIEPKRNNALLTGDIGSGKSTLVDAITTLLVPHQRIVYNKAAGADGKERNLYSYIRGEYKSEKDDFTQSAKAISLRDENSYTVLLGYFYNVGFDQGVTLAQVFWLKDNKRNPERFFVISHKPLTITKHFSGFDSDILTLKKRLRQDDQIKLFDNFKEYSSEFRHLFGIYNEQALELFYQTVSMKSVGNLTEFVRLHMLEKCDIDKRVGELRLNFDNLNRAHEAVLKAKRQIEQLKPLATDSMEFELLGKTITELKQCRDSLQPYFAFQQVALLQENISNLELDIKKDQQKLTSQKEEIQQLYIQETDIRKNIDQNGGQRLQALEQEIIRLTHERERKQTLADRYNTFAEKLDFRPVLNEEDFYSHQQKANTLLLKLEDTQQTLQLKQVDIRIEIKTIQSQQTEITSELDSLKKRQNNIPANMLTLRKEITNSFKLDENKLPFVGELLQVGENSHEWEGAIERLLHNFGLSMLVPEQYYAEVNHYVERTHLKGRLVYYRTHAEKNNSQFSSVESNSLINKLQIKPASQFYPWLENELLNRFNYICCNNLDDFRRFPQAITPTGLTKSKGQRHEKDDRHILNDRSRYILGWSNQQKISALNTKLNHLDQKGQQLITQLTKLAAEQDNLSKQRDACRDLLGITHFTEIHWQLSAQYIQTLSEEKQQIEKSSDILKTLRSQLEKTKQLIRVQSEYLAKIERKLGAREQQLEDRMSEIKLAESLSKQFIDVQLLEKLKQFKTTVLNISQIETLTLSNINKCHSDTRALIQKQTENSENRHKRLISNITQQMQAYKNNYPAETLEIDAAPEAAQEYINILTGLENDDLPRHENIFKKLLNEGTINSIALFQNQLSREKQDIEDRINKINESLQDIEYSTGTYIKLLIDPVQDVDIRNFQQDLRRCLQNTLNDRGFYDEDKFLQVKSIIERFNNRANMIEIDQRWTQKVCDVRNWFNFSASERWFEDQSEKEFYSDSSGKSGGQKEKLAYTILASALAYQFGLEWKGTQSRSFRFVVIDEAFGKGSNDSTRYALELFKKLNLQLLIVTPLQKIHVIEDYIHSIHFVENQNGCNSVIRNLTIEEYQQEKLRFQEDTHAFASAN